MAEVSPLKKTSEGFLSNDHIESFRQELAQSFLWGELELITPFPKGSYYHANFKKATLLGIQYYNGLQVGQRLLDTEYETPFGLGTNERQSLQDMAAVYVIGFVMLPIHRRVLKKMFLTRRYAECMTIAIVTHPNKSWGGTLQLGNHLLPAEQCKAHV